jgi:hypothetical protein
MVLNLQGAITECGRALCARVFFTTRAVTLHRVPEVAKFQHGKGSAWRWVGEKIHPDGAECPP